MSTDIKVSIIVPVYKVPLNYLRECFDSLLAQTMQECEFIVVSDGAPEAECSVCEEYSKKDSRFKFFKREHAGVSATRNHGIEQAQGEYITFVDSDDWIESDMLNDSYAFAQKNSSQLVFWDFSFDDVEKDSIRRVSYYPESILQLNRTELKNFAKSIVHPKREEELAPALTVCKLIQTSLVKNTVRFDEDLTIGEDRVFNFSISKYAKNISYLCKSFYHYRQTESSAIHSYKKRMFTMYLQYIKRLEVLAKKTCPQELATETICSYYGCVDKIYACNLSYNEKIDELYYLKNYVKDTEFNSLIQGLATSLKNLSYAIEIFLTKRKISWLFSLRILKFRLSHFFHSFCQ